MGFFHFCKKTILLIMKVALIFGITGMDGGNLAEFLLNKDYIIHGVIRRSSSFNTGRIDHIYDKLNLHYGDVTDPISCDTVIHDVKPDEIYMLGAQSFVKCSFETPLYTTYVDACGILNILEAAKKHSPNAKIYNASSSEIFGKVEEIPQKETTQPHPRSPYGCAKLYAFWICKNYREAYNMFICNGILFNHEGETRGQTFVTKKITVGLSKISKGKQDVLKLGTIDSKRDWGYSKDYIQGMWLMLQQDKPNDYILSTGETHSIREFVEEAAKYVNMDIIWQGEGVNEKGIDSKTGKIIVEIDKKYFRPAEVDFLLGDSSFAKSVLGWEAKTKFKELVKIMMEYDLKNS